MICQRVFCLLVLGVFLSGSTNGRLIDSPQQLQRKYLADPAPQPRLDFMTEKILKIVEKLREEMKNGFPEANLPPLDPLVLPELDLAPMTILHMGKLDIADFKGIKAEGLQKFVVDEIKSSIFKMEATLNISLSLLNINGNYKINGKFLGILPVFGEGAFACAVQDSKITATAQISTKDGKFMIEKLTIEASLGHVSLHLDGLLGGGNLGEQINVLVENVANRLVQNLAPVLIQDLTEFVRLKLNDIMKNLDIV